ncbi:CopD family protein [Hydromonas duriensis]|uniref:Protoporphyrinogen IX oxidase n=1 Tax=Hydromonas duriensis TaxID=1527608 RepID=A0A4V3DK49_9BURK|nr:CopD family protein [Hydromonas duriensis]TDR32717.1 putative membrane protein [Hydromonas duriensis]
MLYAWLKIFHIVFVMSWFAGLFYLPRIFVNLAQETEASVQQRLILMANRLYRFMHILAVPAIGFGLALWLLIGFKGGWIHIKLTLVLLALAYHLFCGKLLKKFSLNRNTHPHVCYRWFNEIPVILMLAITALVVIKPFSS